MFNQLFTKTIVARDKDGNERGYEYKAIEVAKDINIAIYRERDGEISELHLLDENGDWAGPSVTIYPPDIDWNFSVDEDANPFSIKPAYCSASSSTTDTTAHTRAQARMLMIAADIADDLTARRTPELLAEIAEREVERKQRKAEIERELAAQDRKADQLAWAAVGSRTRVKLVERKSKIAGTLVRSESGRNFFDLDDGNKVHRIHVASIEAAQVLMNGRFSDVAL